MKGIKKILMCVLAIICVTFMALGTIAVFEIHEEKTISTNKESRVISSEAQESIMNKEEMKFLDDSLKSNKNVLLIFVQDLDKDTKAEDIISRVLQLR